VVLATITIPTVLVIIKGIVVFLIGGFYAYEALHGATILVATSLILGLILFSSPLLSALALPVIVGVWLLINIYRPASLSIVTHKKRAGEHFAAIPTHLRRQR
jgi:hypothetical protein